MHNFKPLKLVAILALALSLGACKQGSPFSVVADMIAGRDAETKDSVEHNVDVGASFNAKATVRQPWSGLLGGAIPALLMASGFSEEQFIDAYYPFRWDLYKHRPQRKGWGTKGALSGLPMIMEMAGFAAEDGTITNKMMDWSRKEVERLNASTAQNSAGAPLAEEALECHAKIAQKDYAGARACLELYYTHVLSVAAMAVAHMPVKGTMLPEVVGRDGQARMGTDDPAFDTWLYGSLHAERYANLIETRVSAKLQGAALHDPAAAQSAIGREIVSMSLSEQKSIESDAMVPAGSKPEVIRGAAGSDLEVYVPAIGEKMVQGEKGLVVIKGGAPWFGDGYVSGRQIELTLENGINTSTSDKTSSSDAQTSKYSTSHKAEASVK